MLVGETLGRADDMYRKIRLGFLAIILLLCLSLDAVAQLNFSTGWGKRSQRVGALEWATRTDCDSQGKPSLEQLLTVYNFIQAEARKMLDCRRVNE
ncbi:PREDICTED: adipokinetic prohormone type 2-like [Habropoda laboriosa]|uniref:adipokinetic prohormone type 2-like n=1 Tax=Habropoda laboriosa TaxID=597456 RepID=UPI00083D0C99|nr:PREDICTED: adipokinetic prohormone type 2-like [Habropoda laboriosa]